jgi:hypothetical protein
MANTELTTISRKDVKDVIAPFSPAVRAEIDKAIALANDFAKAHGEEATRLAIQRAIALYHIAEDKEAVKKAGFKTFKELAGVLFNLGASSVTNYRSAAEQFYCNEDAPAVKEWFGPSGLYEFIRGGITNDAIQGGIDRGELKSSMTNSDIRAWVDAQKSLTDGEEEDGGAKLAKLYDGSVIAVSGLDGDKPCKYTATFHGATEDEIRAAIALALGKCIYDVDAPEATEFAAGFEDDRMGRFNPHAELDNGKKKTAGKGLFAASANAMAKVVYFPAAKAKTKTEKGDSAAADTIKAQNDTIAALMAKIAELEAAQK